MLYLIIEIKQSFLTLPCVMKKRCDQQSHNIIEDKEKKILFVLVSFLLPSILQMKFTQDY